MEAPSRRCALRRVYALLLALALGAAPASAQVTLSVEPAMTKGPAGAPVTIVEFSDYECPHCKAVQRTLTQVLAEYPGRVRLVFKDLPLSFHALARAAHEAARCAAAQDRFWPYHDRLFEEQPRFERPQLLAYAADLGLDRERFARCVEERSFAAAVEADVAQARALGITGTPTFLVNGRLLVGAHPPENFRAAIEEALGRR